MLILLSPSKTLDLESPQPAITPTEPRLLDKSKDLITILRKKSHDEIKSLMGISDKLTELNTQRYKDFTTPFTAKNARACIFSFKGDVYDGLDISKFNNEQLQRLQSHVRILSGLYGLLRPFDLMQPYRLEMGTKLENPKGKNLYNFWGQHITDLINQDLQQHTDRTIVNLASNEYFKAVDYAKLDGQLITPVFKERKGNQLKVIGLFAKKARGMMTRHLMMQPSPTSDAIKAFHMDGYTYDESLSTAKEWVFTRKQP